MMMLYVDSADRDVAEPLLRTGVFAGLTTNPTLLARAGVAESQLPTLVDWATTAGAQTVFLQTWGNSGQELLERARALHSLAPDFVVVKVGASEHGITVARALITDNIPVLVTAAYADYQVVPALAVGATFIAPYLGRMDDAGLAGIDEIARMQQAIAATQSPTRILAASVRTADQALQLATAGVRDITLSPQAWHAFFDNELTASAIADFEEAAASVPQAPTAITRPRPT